MTHSIGKKPIQQPIVLRSGTVIDRNFEDIGQQETIPEVGDDAHDSREVQQLEIEQKSEDEWSDVSSEVEDLEEAVEDQTAEFDAMSPEDDLPHIEKSVDHTENASREDSDTGYDSMSEDVHEDENIKRDLMDSPVHAEEGLSTVKLMMPSEPAVLFSPYKRPTSAPPEEIQTQEPRPKPRISDDTAILHAFLNRAAAAKKPVCISKRESLENRRDSDVVRQALASPAKADILAELDPNSPSPRKETSPVKVMRDDIETTPSKVDKHDSEDGDNTRPARRSSRSRARPALLINQSTTDPPRGPNRITIRGPGDQLTLKRSEVQELSSLTRSNTRKNKGQALMPLVRLSKLTSESALEDQGDVASEKPSKEGVRSVRWDQTLVYFQEKPDELSALEIEAVPAQVLAGDIPEEQNPIATEGAPISPKAAESKRIKSVAKETTDEAATPMDQEQPAQAKPKLPPKRKSRIATPGKALRAAAATASALLPADVPVSEKRPKSQPTPTAEPDTKKTPSTNVRALPAPRKLNFAPPTKDSQSKQDAPRIYAPAAVHSLSTPKKSVPAPATGTAVGAGPPGSVSGIPSMKSFAPKLDALSFSSSSALARSVGDKSKDNVAGDAGEGSSSQSVPCLGLASPAKKRRGVVGRGGAGSGLGKSFGREREREREELPLPLGLASPAKKRGRGLLG